MTSVGILTLKIGLVATATGASIVTPILLNRGSGVSSVTSKNSATEGAERQGDVAARNTSDQLVQRREDSTVDSGRSMGMVTTEEQDRKSNVADSSDQENRTEAVSETASSSVESNADISQSDLERESGGQSVQRSDDSVSSLSPSTTSLTSEVSHPET